MLHLTIIRPGGQVLEQGFASNRIVVGRDEACDLRLVDSMVSRNHCIIYREGDRFQIKDLASRNGTWLNGRKVDEVDSIKKGDSIQVGPFRLLVTTPQAASRDGARKFVSPELEDTLAHKDTTEEVVKPLGMISDYLMESTTDLNRVISAERRERFHRNLLALYSIAENLVVTADVDEILDHIMDRIFELFAPSQATILMKGKDGRPVTRKQRNAMGMGNPRSISRTVINRILRERVGVLTDNALEDPRFEDGDTIIIDGIRSIMAAPIWVENRILGVIYVDSLDRIGGYRSEDLELLTAMGHQTALGIQRWNLTRRLNKAAVRNAVIRQNLRRFHSDRVVDRILKGAVDLKARETVASIFFCDIVEFTSLCESGTPEQLQQILTLFCKAVNEAVFEEQGTLDKFIGDAALAFFGAPLTQEDAPVRAARCALSIRERLARQMEQIPDALRFRVRYGINTGRAVVGNFGSSDRMEYTILGHAVNLAARISKSAEPDQILVGPDTHEHLLERGLFVTRSAGARRLKGLKEEIRLFELQESL